MQKKVSRQTKIVSRCDGTDSNTKVVATPEAPRVRCVFHHDHHIRVTRKGFCWSSQVDDLVASDIFGESPAGARPHHPGEPVCVVSSQFVMVWRSVRKSWPHSQQCDNARLLSRLTDKSTNDNSWLMGSRRFASWSPPT